MILAVGDENTDAINASHTIGKGKRQIVHTGHRKVVLELERDATKHEHEGDWIQFVQERLNEHLTKKKATKKKAAEPEPAPEPEPEKKE